MKHEEKGGRVLFITPTARHHAGLDLGLFHQLMRDAWGHMWSGREGQKFAAELGMKPETIRAWDWTASVEKGWHPHFHVLAFVDQQQFSEAELEEKYFERWRASLRSSLERFKRHIRRVLSGASCGQDDCPHCVWDGESERPECAHWLERSRRLFGSKNIPKGDRLDVALRRIRDLLCAFKWQSIEPSADFSIDDDGQFRRVGLCLEYARDTEHVSRYLAKMGVWGAKLAGELAGAVGKVGRIGGDGLAHYSLWEVARIVASYPDAQIAAENDPGGKSAAELQRACAQLWQRLFWARKGMHVIIFSNRERLGLPKDPYADGAEPPEQDPSETRWLIAEADGETWDQNAKPAKHRLIQTLEAAFELGTLAELPWLRPPTWWQSLPATKDPPERPPPVSHDWCNGWQAKEVEDAAELRGREYFRDATAQTADPLPDFLSLQRARTLATLRSMGALATEDECLELLARLEAAGQVMRGSN